MIAEAIDKIEDLVVHGQAATFTTVKGFPNKSVICIPGGKYGIVDHLPAVRDAGFSDIEGLIRYIADTTICPAPEVYIGRDGITLFHDRATRHTEASLTFQRLDRYTALQSLTRGKTYVARAAIDFLRYRLDDTGLTDVIAAIRGIDFKRTSESKSSIQHGVESLGRSVGLSVVQADRIPEEFTVDCSTVANAGLLDVTKCTFRVGLGINLEDECLTFRTYSDEMTLMEEGALRSISDYVRERLESIPVFLGTP